MVESWSECVKELIKGYVVVDIWNEDEIGVFWRVFLSKFFLEKGK